MKVDVDGIHDRITGLDITPGNYSNIRLVDDRIFYLRRTVADEKDEGEDSDPRKRKFHLCFYSLEDRKETVLGDVNSYEITVMARRCWSRSTRITPSSTCPRTRSRPRITTSR